MPCPHPCYITSCSFFVMCCTGFFLLYQEKSQPVQLCQWKILLFSVLLIVEGACLTEPIHPYTIHLTVSPFMTLSLLLFHHISMPLCLSLSYFDDSSFFLCSYPSFTSTLIFLFQSVLLKCPSFSSSFII